MSMFLNAATGTDFYKPGHGPLYPEGTSRKYSNFTPRSAKNFLRSKSCSAYYDNKVVNFGLYGTWQELVDLWDKTFFQVSKKKAIVALKRRFDNATGMDTISTKQIAALHDVGFLPVTVLSIEEGNRVDIGIPLWVIYNSEEYPEHYWLVNYLETITSSYNWQCITNATIAYEYRRVMEHWAAKTCDNNDHVKIQGHDFSFRGMPGPEAAARSNSGHLASFIGTDTIPCIDYIEKLYHANSDTEVLGVSVTATEHAVATANILTNLKRKLRMLPEDTIISGAMIDQLKLECEREYILEIITKKVKQGIISLVCDSFDFWSVIADVLPSIRAEIEARLPDALGFAKVVVRPDSGNPVHVICGFKILDGFDDIAGFSKWVYDNGTFSLGMYEVVRIGEIYYELKNLTWTSCEIEEFLGREMRRAEAIGAIESLWESFGGHTNTKGYRVLNSYIGLIYGDSITVERAEHIFQRLADKGYASSNVVLGIGSFTYQFNTRDTFGMAMKATACEVQDELIELYKDPKTAASKKSAKGFLRVLKDADGKYTLEQEVEMDWKDLFYGSGELKPLFHNGKFQRAEFFRDVRSRIDATFMPAGNDDGFDQEQEAA